MSTVTQFQTANEAVMIHDPVEEEVQRILAIIEAAPGDIQTAVLARLLIGLSARLPAGLASKAIETAKVAPGGTPKQKGSRKEVLQPIYDPQLQKLNDPFDPIEAWEKLGGAEGLQRILPYEATGILETMLRHPNMPAGSKPKSNAKATLAKTIINRLQNHFSGK